MKKISLGIFKDNLINVDYELSIVESANQLADNLKTTLNKLDVDYTKYNTQADTVDKVESNPPREIYEYQNFFILEKSNGDNILLDGFRRLLWYNAPNTPIQVRTYKESDLTPPQILTLLVHLNHFKFFSNSSYHDRGFALLLKTVFDVDITTFRRTFDAYLSSNKLKNDYGYGSIDGVVQNTTIKERIINKYFLSDIRFLETLSKTTYMCDQYVGALLYKNRVISEAEFDVIKFLELADNHKVLQELIGKYQNVGTNNSAKSIELVNKILEIYQNLFTLMSGGEVGLSFAEQQKEAKDMVAKLKKDKSLIKLTGNKSCYIIERVMEKYLADGKPLEFECVIHPRDIGVGYFAKSKTNNSIPYGIRHDIKFIKHTKKHLSSVMEMNFGFTDDNGKEYIIRHNYGSWNSHGTKYTKADTYDGFTVSYDIDLFVRIPKSEIPER